MVIQPQNSLNYIFKQFFLLFNKNNLIYIVIGLDIASVLPGIAQLPPKRLIKYSS